jgi:hypothetical protein
VRLTSFVSFLGLASIGTVMFLSGALAAGCTETPSTFPPCVNPYQGCADEDAAPDGSPDAAADAAAE